MRAPKWATVKEKKIFQDNLHPYIHNAVIGIVSDNYTDDLLSQTYINPTW